MEIINKTNSTYVMANELDEGIIFIYKEDAYLVARIDDDIIYIDLQTFFTYDFDDFFGKPVKVVKATLTLED